MDNFYFYELWESIDEVSDDKFISIIPNPATDFATISFGNSIKNGLLNLYNIEGELLKSIEVINSEKVELYLSNLSSGIYIIELLSREQIRSKSRFVKL